MNRERVRELLPIIQAFAEGKRIQARAEHGTWVEHDGPTNWPDDMEYRIKPEPREFWIDPADFEVWEGQDNPPVPDAIKVREVLPTEVHELDINDD